MSDRRAFLGTGAALVTAALATGDALAQKPESASDAGPENEKLREANPNTFLPPSTDHGEVPDVLELVFDFSPADSTGRLVSSGDCEGFSPVEGYCRGEHAAHGRRRPGTALA